LQRPVPAGLGLALGSSLAFLASLLARPVGDDGVKLVANLAQLLAPVVAAASCAAAMYTAKARGKGRFELASTSVRA
jgi:hypothetical protein